MWQKADLKIIREFDPFHFSWTECTIHFRLLEVVECFHVVGAHDALKWTMEISMINIDCNMSSEKCRLEKTSFGEKSRCL